MESSIHLINALVIGLYSTWFIPVAIRDAKTGEYNGFRNRKVLSRFLILLVIESVLLVPELGFSLLTIARVAFCTLLPFALALLYVSMTHKQLFGKEFSMEIDDSKTE